MNKLPAQVHPEVQRVAPHGLWHLSPDAWTAIGTWALVVAGVGTALVAWFAARRAYGAARAQLAEAEALRREQAQPYVAVFLDDHGGVSPQRVDLVFKNFGATAATNVRVHLNPPPTSVALAQVQDPQPKDFVAIEIPEVVPVLVPGGEWRTFWDTTFARYGYLQSIEPFEDKCEVSVSFCDSKHRPLDDYSYVLDWNTLYLRGGVSVSGLHEIGEATQKISKALSSVISRGSLTVESFDGAEQQRRTNKNRRRRERRFRVAGNSDEAPTRLDRMLVRVEKLSNAARKRLGV